MRFKEFYKQLEELGIEFGNKTNHYSLRNPKNGKRSVIGRHPSQEISTNMVKKILRDLGL